MRNSASFFPADLLSPIPLLSYLNVAIPYFDNSDVNIIKELFFIIGLFPSLSVGPDPAIISATGILSNFSGVKTYLSM